MVGNYSTPDGGERFTLFDMAEGFVTFGSKRHINHGIHFVNAPDVIISRYCYLEYQ